MLSKKTWAIGLSLTLFALVRLYYTLTDDFRIQNIVYPKEMRADLHLDIPSSKDREQLKSVLDQKFTYLGKGAQSYAFASEDGQYVLKFFKFKHLKPNWFMDSLPSFSPFQEIKEKYWARKQRKFLSVFEGYALAYRHDKEAAGLLFLQLTPGENLGFTTSLIDKIGWEREIDLGSFVFLIQRKGVTLRHHLETLFKEERLNQIQDSLAAILKMYVSEYTQGIYDRDHGLLQNTGFVDNRPFHLDVGKLTHAPEMRSPQVYKDDLEWVVWKLNHWIEHHYPAYQAHFHQFLAQQYTRWTEDPLPPPPSTEKHWKAKSRSRYSLPVEPV